MDALTPQRIKDRISPHNVQRPRYTGSAIPFNMYTAPYVDPSPLDTVTKGIRSIVRAMASGAISEEMSIDLIRALATVYAGELISQRVGGYLEHGFTQALERSGEERNPIGS